MADTPTHDHLYYKHLDQDAYRHEVRRMARILVYDLPEVPSSLVVMQALIRLDQEVYEHDLRKKREPLARKLAEIDQALAELAAELHNPTSNEEGPA